MKSDNSNEKRAFYLGTIESCPICYVVYGVETAVVVLAAIDTLRWTAIKLVDTAPQRAL